MSEIGLYVKGKRVVGNFVVLDIGRVSSTMTPLATNELERLVHTLAASKFAERPAPSDRERFSIYAPHYIGSLVVYSF